MITVFLVVSIVVNFYLLIRNWNWKSRFIQERILFMLRHSRDFLSGEDIRAYLREEGISTIGPELYGACDNLVKKRKIECHPSKKTIDGEEVITSYFRIRI